MKKSLVVGLGLVLATTGLTALSTVNVDAHGYVEKPISRAYQGELDSRKNWHAALEKYGEIITEPQSLEHLKDSQMVDLQMEKLLPQMVPKDLN